MKKTAVYTNVNGDIVSYTSKTAKIKKVILPNSTSPNVNVLLSNITFFIFCCFGCVIHYAAVNICINCSFLHLYLLFCYRFRVSSRTVTH